MANARVQSVPHRQRSKPQASNTRASGSQMSEKGYGSFDSVQAPLTLTYECLYRPPSSMIFTTSPTNIVWLANVIVGPTRQKMLAWLSLRYGSPSWSSRQDPNWK